MISVNDTPPQISIITPTYQRARTLARTIRSVRRQTFVDWEQIIVDDGSTDDTASIVGRYVRRDARIRYVHRENGGPVAAMNMGAGLARSPLLAFLDSDDEFAPDHLRLRVDYLSRHPGVDLVWGGLRAIGPRERQFYPDIERPGHRIHASECHVCGTFVLRRTAFERAGGFRRLVSADYDLCQRLEAMGARVNQVPYPTLLHHMEGDDRIGIRVENVKPDGALQPEPDNVALITQRHLQPQRERHEAHPAPHERP